MSADRNFSLMRFLEYRDRYMPVSGPRRLRNSESSDDGSSYGSPQNQFWGGAVLDCAECKECDPYKLQLHHKISPHHNYFEKTENLARRFGQQKLITDSQQPYTDQYNPYPGQGPLGLMERLHGYRASLQQAQWSYTYCSPTEARSPPVPMNGISRPVVNFNADMPNSEYDTECPVCLEQFYSYKEPSYSAHLQTHVVPGTGKLPCRFCGALFHQRQLRKHLAVHLEPVSECRICLKVFPRNADLILHYSITHLDEKDQLRCPYCPEKFHLKKPKSGVAAPSQTLHRHVANSHWTQFQADRAKKGLNKGLPMNDPDANRYQCTICQEYFDSENDRIQHATEEHELTQDQLRPPGQYSCELCHRTFADLRDRESHKEEIHSMSLASGYAKTPEDCLVCLKELPRGELAKHIKEEHEENGLVRCPFCHRMCRYQSLPQHIRKFHMDSDGKTVVKSQNNSANTTAVSNNVMTSTDHLPLLTQKSSKSCDAKRSAPDSSDEPEAKRLSPPQMEATRRTSPSVDFEMKEASPPAHNDGLIKLGSLLSFGAASKTDGFTTSNWTARPSDSSAPIDLSLAGSKLRCAEQEQLSVKTSIPSDFYKLYTSNTFFSQS